MLENMFMLVISSIVLILKESQKFINLAGYSSTIKDKANRGRC